MCYSCLRAVLTSSTYVSKFSPTGVDGQKKNPWVGGYFKAYARVHEASKSFSCWGSFSLLLLEFTRILRTYWLTTDMSSHVLQASH